MMLGVRARAARFPRNRSIGRWPTCAERRHGGRNACGARRGVDSARPSTCRDEIVLHRHPYGSVPVGRALRAGAAIGGDSPRVLRGEVWLGGAWREFTFAARFDVGSAN